MCFIFMIRSNSNKTFTNNINNKTQPAPLCKQETSSQDVSEKKENSEPQTFPFYAKVDKKKKRVNTYCIVLKLLYCSNQNPICMEL